MSIEEFRNIEDRLREQNVYIMSSVDGKGVHIGRFKGFSRDANDDLIIEADIDAVSCTG